MNFTSAIKHPKKCLEGNGISKSQFIVFSLVISLLPAIATWILNRKLDSTLIVYLSASIFMLTAGITLNSTLKMLNKRIDYENSFQLILSAFTPVYLSAILFPIKFVGEFVAIISLLYSVDLIRAGLRAKLNKRESGLATVLFLSLQTPLLVLLVLGFSWFIG